MKRSSKMEKALELLGTGMKPKEVAKKAEVSLQTVYSARYKAKKNGKKRKSPTSISYKTKNMPMSTNAMTSTQIIAALLETANDCHRLANILQTLEKGHGRA